MNSVELDHDKYSAYLNQHLVAADAGVRAFAAAGDTWKDTQWEATFRQLHDELEDSHTKLKELIERLGYRISMVRNVVAGVAAVAGRVNPLNFTRNNDGLMTQEELDALAAALRGQQMMWETLVVLADIDDRLDKAECQTMVERCESQRDRVRTVSETTVKDRFTRDPDE